MVLSCSAVLISVREYTFVAVFAGLHVDVFSMCSVSSVLGRCMVLEYPWILWIWCVKKGHYASHEPRFLGVDAPCHGAVPHGTEAFVVGFASLMKDAHQLLL